MRPFLVKRKTSVQKKLKVQAQMKCFNCQHQAGEDNFRWGLPPRCPRCLSFNVSPV
jgi:Zn finger protein HypA/HybF involved in hydrogenase expression